MKTAFCGTIDEIPFIHVDNFENKFKSAYFLSHFHGDHIFGLKAPDLPDKLKENNSFIYASAVTVAIVKNEFPDLIPYLKILELGRNTIEINEDNKTIYLNIITLPAGHSLGSVMFLFEHNHTILYTGDFRITPNSVSKYSHLHNKDGAPRNLDALYIDTTFQDVPSFPRRSEVIRNIVQYVKDWLTKEKNNVVLVTSACFGYEAVCNELVKATGIKTYIGEKKWKVFSQFPKEMHGITNDASSRIHLCTKYENKHPNVPETLFIHFSAMIWGNSATEDNFINVERKNKMAVCFATHCGRDELLHFINYFPVKKLIGFPEPFKYKNNPVLLDIYQKPVDFDCDSLQLDSCRPAKRLRSDSKDGESMVGKKVDRDKLKNMFDW